MHIWTRAALAAAAAVLAALLALPAGAGPPPATVAVVADHLNNPRQVAIGPDGAIYVAQAGKAGKLCLDPEKTTCLGPSGAITRIQDGIRTRIARKLVSVGGRDGSFTTGPNGISTAPDGTVWVAMTAAPCGMSLRGIPHTLKRQLGRLLLVEDDGVRRAGNIARVECTTNPDGTDRNSNPYAVLALSDRVIVVDAGANALFSVQNGQVTLLALLPPNGDAQSVPTSIALGPDGNYYVGEFVGEGSSPANGTARVFKVTPAGVVSVHMTGFTAITGVAFGADGSLYVTEWTTDHTSDVPSGDVVRVAPDGSRTSLGAGELFFPSGAAVDADGTLYVSNWSILPAHTAQRGPFGGANGQLVSITQSANG